MPPDPIDSFKVVLDGTILAGSEPAAVKEQFAALIKRDVEFAGRLLIGQKITIKSGVDAAVGERYITALRHIGVSASLQPETLEIDSDLSLGPVSSSANPLWANEAQSGASSATPISTESPRDGKLAELTQSAPSDTTLTLDYHRAAIGPKNQGYYLSFFAREDAARKRLHSWSWPAFFCGGAWLLYRKMPLWFIAYWVVLAFSNGMERGGYFWSSWIVAIPLWLIFPVYANSLYHANIKKKIAAVRTAGTDPVRVVSKLCASGGVHKWVPWVFGAIPVIGVLAAIAIPAYQDYTKRADPSVVIPTSKNPFDDPNLGANLMPEQPPTGFKPFTGTLDSPVPGPSNPPAEFDLSKVTPYIPAPTPSSVDRAPSPAPRPVPPLSAEQEATLARYYKRQEVEARRTEAKQRAEEQATRTSQLIPNRPQVTELRFRNLVDAVLRGTVIDVRQILDEGADVSGRWEGTTPLISAVKFGKLEIAELLIERGAELERVDNKGFTAMKWAKQARDGPMVGLLERAGAKNPYVQ